MGRNNRRHSNKELRDMQKIEKLLHNYDKGIESTIVKVEEVKVVKPKPVVNKNSNNEGIHVFDTIRLSDHATQKAKERFDLDRSEALTFFRNILKKARRIGLQQSGSGTESIFYATSRIGVYVSTDMKTIITVCRQESVSYLPLKDKFAELHEKEIRRLERLESSKVKNLKYEQLKANVEISNLELRIHKSRYDSVRIACEARKIAIQQYIDELTDEVDKIKASKRIACRSMASVV